MSAAASRSRARIIFMGSPNSAVPTLHALAAFCSRTGGHELLGVVTDPDNKPTMSGKPQRLASAVARAAKKMGLDVYKPDRIRRACKGSGATTADQGALAFLRSSQPDLIVACGFNQILPQEILDIPRCGVTNLHPTLLPLYPGRAPVQWPVANGDLETGVSLHLMDTGIDTGPLFAQERVPIGPFETAPTLRQLLSAHLARLLLLNLEGILADKLKPTAQPKLEDCIAGRKVDALTLQSMRYTRDFTDADGEIQWSWPARRIHNLIRAFHDWPDAKTSFRGQRFRLRNASPYPAASGDAKQPGTIDHIDPEMGISVVAGDGRRIFIHNVIPVGLEEQALPLAGVVTRYRFQVGSILGDIY